MRELLHEVLDKQLRATDAEAADGARARPRGDLDRRPAAPATGCRRPRRRWRARSRCSARARRPRSPPSSPTSTRRPPRRRSRRLCRADVLTRDGDRLDFVHPIVLSAIYNDLPVRARSEGHGRAARLLQRARRGARGGRLAARADRAARATTGWSRRCAPRPRGRCRSATRVAAAAHLPRALAEPPRRPRGDPRRPRPGRGQSGAPAAVEHFREAMRLAATPTRARAASRSASRAA